MTTSAPSSQPTNLPPTVVRQCKKTADPQMAHLVFADTRPKTQKPKEPFFLPTHRLIKATLLIIKSSFTWDKN